MKLAHLSLLLCATPLAFGAGPKIPVTVRVDWLNYDQLHCKGCRTQLITMDADSFCIIGEDTDQKTIWTKISNHWIGRSIQVSVTAETHRDDNTFIDGVGESVVVAEQESKELKAGDVRYRISARRATEAELTGPVRAKNDPNQSPNSTPASVTPAAGQPPRHQ